MESLYVIKEAACDRLHDIADEIRDKGGLPDNCIELTDKLTHIIKSTMSALDMYESGYSENDGYSERRSYDGGSSMSMGGSYGNANGGGYSERRGRSRVTGRFVSRDSGYSGRRGRYSMDDGEAGLMTELDAIMRDTNDNAVKQRIGELKKRMGGNQ